MRENARKAYSFELIEPYLILKPVLKEVEINLMTNNDIFKKLRVALKLRDDDIIKILSLVDFRISKSELGAFFRKEDHPKYMECGDQILRNFLNGLVIHLRGPMPKKGEKSKTQNPKSKSLENKSKPDVISKKPRINKNFNSSNAQKKSND